MTRFLVFGTGNIGSIYTCILYRAGASVTCVCRSNYDVVHSHGLRATSTILGDLKAHPAVVRNVSDAVLLSGEHFDFILVCTKATPQSTSAAIESIKPAITPGSTAIVLIQNGLGVEKAYYNAFPETAIISGVAYLPTTQTSPGMFSHSETELLFLGLYHPVSNTSEMTAQLELLVQQFQAGGATVVVSEDIQAERWTKMLANGAINPICALSRCRDRQLIEISNLTIRLLQEVMQEIAAVAASEGYRDIITAETLEKQLSRSLSRPYPGVQPSMMADMMASRPLEVHAILGEIVRIARSNGIDIPRLTTLFVLLEGLDFALRLEREGIIGSKE